MAINRLDTIVQLQKAKPTLKQATPKSAGKEIVSNFSKMFDKVNEQQQVADKKIENLAAGKNKDVAGTMIAMEKADVSMRMLMAVRNKVVSAYEEVMRMQI